MPRTFDAEKQVRFALAKTLTQTAKEAQKNVLADIGSTFTVRNNWAQPSNAMGVKVLPASKTDLSAAVATKADWLIQHEEGEDKVPTKGRHIAVPTKRVRRTKRDIIARAQRPRNLKRSFVVKRKDGDLWLYMRTTKKRYPITPMYKLTGRARIRRQSTVVDPVVATVEKHFGKLLEKNLRQVFRTAR